MPLNWGMLALIVGAVLGVSAILFAKNKGTRKALGWIGAILIIPGIVVLAFPGTLTFLEGGVSFGGGQLAVTTPTAITPITPSLVCPPGSVEDVTVTFSGVDAVTGGATGGSHAYKKLIDGVWGPIKSVADAGTDTFSAGDKLQVLFGNSSVNANYYGNLKEFALPCSQGTFTASSNSYANGTRTLNVFNEEGQPIAGATPEALASGDVATIDIEIRTQFQKGEVHGGIIVAEYNSSNYDDVIIKLGGVKVDKPDFYSLVGTANTTRAYSVGPFFGVDKLTGTITIDVKSTADPTSAVGNISLIYYPYNYYIDEDTGSAFAGPDVEDEDAVKTRADWSYFNVIPS